MTVVRLPKICAATRQQHGSTSVGETEAIGLPETRLLRWSELQSHLVCLLVEEVTRR
jgi:hypothetical protein